ncbi:MAG: hypothetical protein ACXWUN_01550, partial [Allosphingosinicella sp.]
AGLIAGFVMRDIDPQEIQRYLPGVRAVTPADAQATAAELLSPEGATIVIVGEAAQFVDRLRAEGRRVTVIPLAELDLDRAELRRE